MSEKKFEVYLVAEGVDKSTFVNLKRIRVLGEENWFRFPAEVQKISAHHTALASLPSIKSALNVIKNRGQFRNVKVTCPDTTVKLYMDTDENFVFNGLMLEEIPAGSSALPPDPKVAELASCISKLATHPESVKEILKHFLVEKFSPKNRNVEAWCTLFEQESSRFSLVGQKQIEVFKSCLDPSMNDWFAVSQRKLALTADWKDWKELLLSSFSDSSWKPIRHAFNFRYIGGSYIDYAIKKERLLLELDRALPDLVILDLIVVGLPHSIQNSLNRNTVTSIKVLHNKLKKFESEDKESQLKSKPFRENFNKKKSDDNQEFVQMNKNFNVNRKPCSICLKKGANRFHSENVCWNKEKIVSKTVNSTEMESSSFEEESKN